MNAIARLASKWGARAMSAEDQPDAARRELRAAHPELPEARFLAPARGQYPCESTDWGSVPLVIALPPEHSRGLRELQEFVLHAAAPAIEVQRNGGKPAGNRGRYHPAAFGDIARDELDLVVTGSGAGLGWHQTSPPSRTPPARPAEPATSHDKTG
ncbi:MAG: hypothetical protein M3Y33_00610 [Actinomycetota bacterium]|nr:hypothetical protein [Actinomycetota bacterium]